ncbi:hypothetical protein GH733_004473 [Mirounga leonina]|nr:hypothetical protein GH733_004473 [Mirounga leonina]
MTNETLNIWTHLLPFWFFVWRFVTALYVTDIQNDSYSWPLFVYMGTSCVYPLASSCAHTFSSMSKNARHICYFLDYGAVNLFSLGSRLHCGLASGPRLVFSSPGSAIAYSAYSIPDVMVCTAFHDYYVPLAVLNTIVSTGLSCYSRFLEIQKPALCKMLRVLAFAYPYTWDSLPIFYRLFLLPGESVQNEAVLNHQKHMAMTLLASFFYSAHLPERLAPGRFDYIAILLDKTLRKEWLLAHSRPLSFPQITGAILLCLIFSLSNIIYFSAALYRIPEPELHKKET